MFFQFKNQFLRKKLEQFQKIYAKFQKFISNEFIDVRQYDLYTTLRKS